MHRRPAAQHEPPLGQRVERVLEGDEVTAPAARRSDGRPDPGPHPAPQHRGAGVLGGVAEQVEQDRQLGACSICPESNDSGSTASTVQSSSSQSPSSSISRAARPPWTEPRGWSGPRGTPDIVGREARWWVGGAAAPAYRRRGANCRVNGRRTCETRRGQPWHAPWPLQAPAGSALDWQWRSSGGGSGPTGLRQAESPGSRHRSWSLPHWSRRAVGRRAVGQANRCPELGGTGPRIRGRPGIGVGTRANRGTCEGAGPVHDPFVAVPLVMPSCPVPLVSVPVVFVPVAFVSVLREALPAPPRSTIVPADPARSLLGQITICPPPDPTARPKKTTKGGRQAGAGPLTTRPWTSRTAAPPGTVGITSVATSGDLGRTDPLRHPAGSRSDPIHTPAANRRHRDLGQCPGRRRRCRRRERPQHARGDAQGSARRRLAPAIPSSPADHQRARCHRNAG